MGATVELKENAYIDADDFSSVQEEEIWRNSGSPSGDSWCESRGSVVTLKNGRKIYVKDVTPKEIMTKIEKAKAPAYLNVDDVKALGCKVRKPDWCAGWWTQWSQGAWRSSPGFSYQRDDEDFNTLFEVYDEIKHGVNP